ncbi:MAG: GNAT family N-acetyltransferase [Chitinophagales bacterium]|nr:GNAT family N-acetyltransferase [Chitinophagales bacterium]
MQQKISIKLFLGKKAEQYIDEVANLRIKIFREFPYLYDGDKDYEKHYLKKFIGTEDSLIAIAFDENSVIGALTGLPLKLEEQTIYQAWIQKGDSIDKVYYFSEALIFKAYRRQGIGKALFTIAESWVSSTNQFETYTLATVIRANNHPKRPQGYTSSDAFWLKLDYKKTDDIICTISWKEVGEETESSKPLLFWSKKK